MNFPSPNLLCHFARMSSCRTQSNLGEGKGGDAKGPRARVSKTLKMDEVATRLAQQWNFAPTVELPGGHCSRVYADAERVLKVPFQGEEMTSGFWAMMAFDGEFKPEIYASDPGTGSLLMQRANPGRQLHETGLSEAAQLVHWGEIVQSWRATPGDQFMTLEAFSNPNDTLARHLLETTKTTVAMHGDLHHGNILSHGKRWLCIDAKGVVGDPAFEGAAMVRNPLPEVGDHSATRMVQRVHDVANVLDVDPFRVWGWSIGMLRDGGDPELGPWRNVLDRLYECAPTFGAEEWVNPICREDVSKPGTGVSLWREEAVSPTHKE